MCIYLELSLYFLHCYCNTMLCTAVSICMSMYSMPPREARVIINRETLGFGSRTRRFERNKNVSSPSTCEIQYCGEPPWPTGSVLGLRPPLFLIYRFRWPPLDVLTHADVDKWYIYGSSANLIAAHVHWNWSIGVKTDGFSYRFLFKDSY